MCPQDSGRLVVGRMPPEFHEMALKLLKKLNRLEGN